VESGAMSETFIIEVKKNEKNEFTLILGQ